MLVKRKNPLSDVFDAYSEQESDETLWPEDEALPPALEPSGYRPAPIGFNEASDITELDARTSEITELDARTSEITELDARTSEITELDAEASALPTPRRMLQWTLDEPDADTPLPVVTAATEPTQRGLGIPPPPSSREVAWFAQLPSLASAPPLSAEAFTDRGAPEALAREPSREQNENERITVRAPPTRSPGMLTGRRRRVAVVLLAAAALVAALTVRHSTVRDGRPEAATQAPAMPATPPAATVETEQARLPESIPHVNVPPSPADTTAADSDSQSEPRHHRSRKESRREKARRKAAAAAKARSSVVSYAPALNMPRSQVDLPTVEEPKPARREALSLPPR
jgi:hypothetical protein